MSMMDNNGEVRVYGQIGVDASGLDWEFYQDAQEAQAQSRIEQASDLLGNISTSEQIIIPQQAQEEGDA